MDFQHPLGRDCRQPLYGAPITMTNTQKQKADMGLSRVWGLGFQAIRLHPIADNFLQRGKIRLECTKRLGIALSKWAGQQSPHVCFCQKETHKGPGLCSSPNTGGLTLRMRQTTGNRSMHSGTELKQKPKEKQHTHTHTFPELTKAHERDTPQHHYSIWGISGI